MKSKKVNYLYNTQPRMMFICANPDCKHTFQENVGKNFPYKKDCHACGGNLFYPFGRVFEDRIDGIIKYFQEGGEDYVLRVHKDSLRKADILLENIKKAKIGWDVSDKKRLIDDNNKIWFDYTLSIAKIRRTWYKE